MRFFRAALKNPRNFQEILSNPVLAYEEGLKFFNNDGLLHQVLHRLAGDLDEKKIDYCLIGGMALNLHGYKRFTSDIDVLLSPEGYEEFRSKLVGVGYRPKFEGATRKFLIFPEKVEMDVLKSGEYAGDGKKIPIKFSAPEQVSVAINGLKTARLETLIEWKLASGMSEEILRMRDIADVIQLIQIKNLDESFSSKLSPFVQEKFLELAKKIKESKEKNYKH